MDNIKFRCYMENLAVPGSNEFMLYSDECKSMSEFWRQARCSPKGSARHIMLCTGEKDYLGREIYVGDGGVDAFGIAYCVRFGSYRDNSRFGVGFYLQWDNSLRDKTYRKDLGFWIREELDFYKNIYQDAELKNLRETHNGRG